MSRLFLAFLLVAIVFVASSQAQGCGKNSHAVTSYKHENCYDNCQNKDQPRPCPYLLNHGPFCECHEGYIFKSGTSGDCVKPNEC